MRKYKSNTKLNTKNTPTWCPGCGDFGIWMAFKDACLRQGWDNTNTAILAGIGCHGHIINHVKISSIECLHGRSLPVAIGVKMANTRLNVFDFTGDGDSLAEGGNHFIHAARRNHDITVILHDNAVYGLTTGQTSPRSPHGYISKSTPEGNKDEPFQPTTLAIASGATFVARCYAGDIEKLTEIIIEAANHKGFALIDVLQPCVTFNKIYTHDFYQKNTYYVDESYDPTNKIMALETSMRWDYNQIALGILYREAKASYEEQLTHLDGKPLVDFPIEKRDISDLYKQFR